MRYNTVFSGDIEDWFSGITNVVMRYWIRKSIAEDPSLSCEYGFFQQLIKVGDRYIVGINPLDEDTGCKRFPSIEYYYLDEIEFVMYQQDQEDVFGDVLTRE